MNVVLLNLFQSVQHNYHYQHHKVHTIKKTFPLAAASNYTVFAALKEGLALLVFYLVKVPLMEYWVTSSAILPLPIRLCPV